MTTITLNYILGDKPELIFTTDIDSNATVNALKNRVKQNDPRLSNISAPELQLFKLKVPLAPKDLNHISNPPHPDGVEKLSDVLEPLSEFFENLPSNKVHVIVLLPNVKQKRARSPSLSLRSRLKKTKLGTEAPSRLGQPSVYWTMQADPAQRLLDDRPSPDASIAPIALLYAGFGRFDDIVTGRMSIDTVIRDNSINASDFDTSASAFLKSMSDKFDKESDRLDEGLKHLNRIIGAAPALESYRLSAARIDKYYSDGRSIDKDGQPLSVVEFKNLITNIQADPCVEAVGYVAKHHMAMEKDLHWRLPCLVITVVGHTITFYATVLLKDQYRVVSLTPTLSCLDSASDGRDTELLRLAFAATIDFHLTILADIQRYSNTPPTPILPETHRLPAVTRLRKHGAVDDYVEFQIQEYFGTRQPYRELYMAEAPTDADDYSMILVKFSRTYCVDLHDYCSKAGHAPKLLAFEELPGGWYGIAMEYLKDTDPLNTAQFNDDLKKLIEGFHGLGWVHGDLRDANIRSREDGFWLIDFDWGGKEGEAKYPTRYLNEELTAGRVSNDLIIRKEDDMRVLCRTLNKCNG